MFSSLNSGGNPQAERVLATIQRLASDYPEQVLLKVPLRDLTTFRIGGPATGVCEIKTPTDARKFQLFAQEHDLPFYTLGGGSNILADDAGFNGLILKIKIDSFEVDGESVRVGAGLNFDQMIAQTLGERLTGLEFASGIPGTVGGAVVGNAGCYGHEISEFILAATVLRPDGRLETIGPEEMGFRYRHSDLKESSDLLMNVVLKLDRGDITRAWETREEKIEIRRQKHPIRRPCAGSYFKNLAPQNLGGNRRAAGELLELAGAKSLRVGDAAVYEKHANIIVNEGRATSSDVLALANLMKDAVLAKFGLRLQEEVRYLTSGGIQS